MQADNQEPETYSVSFLPAGMFKKNAHQEMAGLQSILKDFL